MSLGRLRKFLGNDELDPDTVTKDDNASMYQYSGFYLRVRNRKIIFLLLNQNICCGYSKEPSQ